MRPAAEELLAVRRPFHADALLGFLAAHVVTGLEAVTDRTYARILRLPHGPGVVAATLGTDHVGVDLELADGTDRGVALDAVRHLLDLDVDPVAVDTALAADPALAPLVHVAPGIRVPGSTDGYEVAVRTVVGQQVSVAGAQTVTARIVEAHGEPVESDLARHHGLTHAFPDPDVLAEADPVSFSMPRSRGETIGRVAHAVATGELDLRGGADPSAAAAALTSLRGIGPWTADYVRMRALGDPDVLLTTDLVLRRELESRGITPRAAERWSPWRSYAGMHLWRAAAPFLSGDGERIDP